MKLSIALATVMSAALGAGPAAGQVVDADVVPTQPLRVSVGGVRAPTSIVRAIPFLPSSLDPTRLGVRFDPSRFGTRPDPTRWGVRLNPQLRGEAIDQRFETPPRDRHLVDEPRRRADSARVGRPVTRDNFKDVVRDLRRRGETVVGGGCAGGACCTGSLTRGILATSADTDARLTAPVPDESAGAGAAVVVPRALAVQRARESDWAGAVSALAMHLEADPDDFAAARELALLLVLAGDAEGAAGVMHMAHAHDPVLARSAVDLRGLGLDIPAAQELTRSALAWAERQRTPASYLLAAVVSQARSNPAAVRRFLDRAERAGLDAIILAGFPASDAGRVTAGVVR
jgi:hypothetical protein